MHLTMAYDLAKRDAIKVYVSRLVDWTRRRELVIEDAKTEGDRLFRAAYNQAMADIRRYLLG